MPSKSGVCVNCGKSIRIPEFIFNDFGEKILTPANTSFQCKKCVLHINKKTMRVLLLWVGAGLALLLSVVLGVSWLWDATIGESTSQGDNGGYLLFTLIAIGTFLIWNAID